MINNSLVEKPKASARNLYPFLRALPNQAELSESQHKALNKDIEKIKFLISKMCEANTKEEWREILSIFGDMSRSIGGYVGDEPGQNLEQRVDTLWNNILTSYSNMR
jgi:hypothetical protein